ncbi:MAG: bifunctional lysylphosphatidylglycerol flippase/synthetase MprF [Gemmatimonadaceae bacterium]
MTNKSVVHAEQAAWRRWLVPLASLLVLGIALFALKSELHATSYHLILQAAESVPGSKIRWALALTIVGYFVLPLYDVLGLRYAKHPIPWRRSYLTSFLAYAFSQILGFAAVTGGAIRLRFWTIEGLTTAEVARAAVFSAIGFWVGVGTICGLALIFVPLPDGALQLIPFHTTAPFGVLLLVAVVAYLLFATFRNAPLVVRDWELDSPGPLLAFGQLGVALTDWLLAALVCWVLLPKSAISFPAFVGLFALAQAIGLLSHVPGGLGVFDGLMVILLKQYIPSERVLASLLVYRLAYYMFPFVAASITMSVLTIRRRREVFGNAVRNTARMAKRWGPTTLPTILSAAVFASGVVLLISGATPAERSRIAFLDRVLPLGIIELSHLSGSVVGVAMLVLAWALKRRIDAAWGLAVIALCAGIAASLLKGLDWEEASVLAVVLLIVAPSRHAFHRRAALFAEPMEPAWIVSIVAALLASVALGLFAFRHVEYADSLWWRFAQHADAPRFMRSTLLASTTVLVLALMRLLRTAPAEPEIATKEELQRAQNIVRDAPDTRGNLALLGDKALLIDEANTALLMYGVEGRSWVAVGDPLGDEDAGAELAWQFREMADRHGGWTVFYEVGTERLPLYIDLGLSLLKIGEEAIVHLDKFTLEGGSNKSLRRSLKDADKKNIAFEVVPVENVPPLMPQLRRISDAWLAEKSAREKGFSLGRFDEQYLSHHPIALVYHEGNPVAFANLWTTATRDELSVDLMRWSPEAPAGMMDFLFLRLMLWGQAEGYKTFNLGMAPMSGLENRTLAPLWSRAGSLLYRFGEHFYNFRGLRQYKEKFDPVWEPRYIASPGGLALPRILANVASLISGGLGGIVRK